MARPEAGDRIAGTGTQSRRARGGERNGVERTLTELPQKRRGPAAASVAVEPIGVILILSSKLERLGWSIVVESQADMKLLGQFATLNGALDFLEGHGADVALVDEAMLTPKRCEALRRLAAGGGPRMLLVARHPIDDAIRQSRYGFASSWLLKGISAEDLLAAIRERPAEAGGASAGDGAKQATGLPARSRGQLPIDGGGIYEDV